ncbi:MAG: NAD(P)-dependent oxidoreductase, partial [Proteobacteria bacterium]|nr:NAD(P)-dependent oxidoreductase [Pseudomonadota bacterium]
AVAPLSQYGRSKLAGEQAVTEISSDHLILRTAWLYGWGGKNFLKTMLRLALADPSRELKVVNDQHGSLTWTATLARQIETVLTSDLQGIVHATAEGSSTWYQGACYFLDAMEISHNLVPCSTSEYPTPAHRPANSILENRRLKQAGLSIFNSWQGDIDAFVRLYRKELLQEAKG